MKIATQTLLILAGSLISISSLAQQIIGVSPSTKTQLDVFSEPKTNAPTHQISVDKLSFPLDVQKSTAGFYEVTIEGQPVWVRTMHVRVSKTNAAACSEKTIKSGLVIAHPGAGPDVCQ